MTPSPQQQFTRQAVHIDGIVKIASVCNFCAFRIVASHDALAESESLEAEEAEHAKKCYAIGPVQFQAQRSPGVS